MRRNIWRRIAVLATGVLLALGASVRPRSPVAAQDAAGTQESLADLLVSDGLTREQMAQRYAALAAAQFQPPACVAGQEMFTDVPASNLFCSWIEELARRGITGGCTATRYCPNNPVTRAQMAVFVVKAMETCPTLDPADEMIRVGGVCIDKYEASIWDAPVGGNQIIGDVPSDYCNPNGQDCDSIYARSVAGVEPARHITWFQAQQALANSGKRLPTNAEWQMAVRGTPDHPGPCHTDTASVEPTGSSLGCVSDWGAFDMVGNVWEWVADWVPVSTHCPGWGSFSDDSMCLSGASTALPGPGALIRGGDIGDASTVGAAAGPFAVHGGRPPSISGTPSLTTGFRGAR